MSKYTVYLTQTASCSVEVEADYYESAVDQAFEKAPSTLCAHCTGWGSPVGIDLAGYWDLDEVEDEAGRVVDPDA